MGTYRPSDGGVGFAVHIPPKFQTGGQYTLKVYHSEKAPRSDDEWAKTRITLSPLNPEFSPIVLEASDDAKVRVVAELVRALG